MKSKINTKILLSGLLVLMLIAVSACNGSTDDSIENGDAEAKNIDVDENADGSMEVKADTNENGDADISVKTYGSDSEVTIDFDDVQDEATKEAMDELEGKNMADFCVPGTTYDYAGEGAEISSTVIGMENFKGQDYCKAEYQSEMDTPAGTISTDTTYYFDVTEKDFWVITTVSSPMMPQPQTTEIHIVDGKVE